MVSTTLKIDGMMCGMCEAHVNDAIRSKFKVKKVVSSHTKGETVITSAEPLDVHLLAQTVNDTGYKVTGISETELEDKKLFGFFRK